MANPLSALIEIALDAHRDAGTHSNPELAETLANVLTAASWQQLADVTGAQIETDCDGQLVLYTGCNVALPVFVGAVAAARAFKYNI
jgi:hypothetical protein